jgi:DNA-directed RNA polymerase specialized sigma24 family protein
MQLVRALPRELPPTGPQTVQLAVSSETNPQTLEARKRLWERYDRPVVGLFQSRWHGSGTTPEDLAQGFLAKMFGTSPNDRPRILDYDPNHPDGRGFRPWLRRCAINYLRDELRKADFRFNAAAYPIGSATDLDTSSERPDQLLMQQEEPDVEQLQEQFDRAWACEVVQEAIRVVFCPAEIEKQPPVFQAICSDIRQGIVRDREYYRTAFNLTPSRLRAQYFSLRKRLKEYVREAILEDGLLPFQDNLELSIDTVFHLVRFQDGASPTTQFRAIA